MRKALLVLILFTLLGPVAGAAGSSASVAAPRIDSPGELES